MIVLPKNEISLHLTETREKEREKKVGNDAFKWFVNWQNETMIYLLIHNSINLV